MKPSKSKEEVDGLHEYNRELEAEGSGGRRRSQEAAKGNNGEINRQTSKGREEGRS